MFAYPPKRKPPGSIAWIAAVLYPEAVSAGATLAAVLAVFPIQDSAGKLQPTSVLQLTDYLGAKIAATGRYVLVPAKDLTQVLEQKKVESYKSCVDQACQIEIGKELAAQKVLQTQIIKAGDQCAVTATVYDLRVSATEAAAVEKGGCSENAIVELLDKVAATLAGGTAGPVANQGAKRPDPPQPVTPTFALRVEVDPSDAEVLVDGKVRGTGQARVELDATRDHTLRVQREGFVAEERAVHLERDDSLKVALKMTDEYRLGRRELFGLSLALDVTPAGTFGVGLWCRAPTLTFGAFAWTIAEVLGGVGFGEGISVGISERNAAIAVQRESAILGTLAFATRLGVHLPLGDRDLLELGVGGGYLLRGSVSRSSVEPDANGAYSGLLVEPVVRYLHTGDGVAAFGVGLRALLPVTGLSPSCPLSGSVEKYVACVENEPLMLQLEVPLGLYF